MTTDVQKKKGWDAEEALRKLLDSEGIAHLPFCDNEKKFSFALKNYFATKRPDIMILFRYIGFLFVEVKHKHPYENFGTFLVDAEEAEKYAHFREVFGHEVWYAISNSSDNFKTWYWLPSFQATQGHPRISTKEGDCFAVPIKNFLKVETFGELTTTLLQMERKSE